MDTSLETARDAISAWWWVVALVVVFAVIYRTGAGGSGRSASAGFGCLAAVVITLVFVAVVIL
jgi:hypothetical protein